jgi:hypothetical protein
MSSTCPLVRDFFLSFFLSKNPRDVFLLSLHFVEDLASVKSDFGEQFDQ